MRASMVISCLSILLSETHSFAANPGPFAMALEKEETARLVNRMRDILTPEYGPRFGGKPPGIYLYYTNKKKPMDVQTDGFTVNILYSLTGGFVSSDVLALAVCHEYGHLLGDRSRFKTSGTGLAVEGEADYFATSDCLPRLLPHLPVPPNQSEEVNIRNWLQDRCENTYPGDPDRQRICVRIGVASDWTSARFVWGEHYYGNVIARPRFDTPDPTVVEKTNRRYPPYQCRLDTMLAGALGAPRPACWYRASSEH